MRKRSETELNPLLEGAPIGRRVRRLMNPLNRAALLAMLLLFVSCSTAQPAGQVTKPAQIVNPLNDAQRVARFEAGKTKGRHGRAQIIAL